MKANVWLITGAGGGIGCELVKFLIKKGVCVVALTRDREQLQTKMEYPKDNLLIVEVDLRDGKSIKEAVELAVNTFGRIDVVVNNAGYELAGYVEEISIDDFKEEFEINFWAPLRIIQAVLPIMRERKSGYFINMSSKCGVCYSYAGSVAYNTSKAAVDCLSKTLANEVQDKGINVTSMILGQFRTKYFENIKWSETNNNVYQYEIEKKKENMLRMNQKQKGDVHKLCQLMFELSQQNTPPKELYVGQDAYALGYEKALSILGNLKKWELQSRNMDLEEE